jgi:hypothetical protein
MSGPGSLLAICLLLVCARSCSLRPALLTIVTASDVGIHNLAALPELVLEVLPAAQDSSNRDTQQASEGQIALKVIAN